MARIRGFIASSLDGFIATRDGKLDWLTKYDDMDFGEVGYDRFIAPIRTIVMGRATYDWILANADWPYTERRSIVVTSRPLPQAPAGVEVWSRGVDALVADLRARDDGDVWMAGGGALQMAFIERSGLDELDLTIVPELIGGGVPLFPPTGMALSPQLVAVTPLPRSVVHLRYRFG